MSQHPHWMIPENSRLGSSESGALWHSGGKKIQHRLLVDLVTNCGHMVAVWYRHCAAVGEGGRQRARRTGQYVLFAAHDQHRPLCPPKLLFGEDIAIAAHAGGECDAILAG